MIWGLREFQLRDDVVLTLSLCARSPQILPGVLSVLGSGHLRVLRDWPLATSSGGSSSGGDTAGEAAALVSVTGAAVQLLSAPFALQAGLPEADTAQYMVGITLRHVCSDPAARDRTPADDRCCQYRIVSSGVHEEALGSSLQQACGANKGSHDRSLFGKLHAAW